MYDLTLMHSFSAWNNFDSKRKERKKERSTALQKKATKFHTGEDVFLADMIFILKYSEPSWHYVLHDLNTVYLNAFLNMLKRDSVSCTDLCSHRIMSGNPQK